MSFQLLAKQQSYSISSFVKMSLPLNEHISYILSVHLLFKKHILVFVYWRFSILIFSMSLSDMIISGC